MLMCAKNFFIASLIRVILIGVMPKGAVAVPKVAAGYNHGVALKSDGTVWTWGYNGYGQLGDGTTANKAIPMQVKGAGGSDYLTDVVDIEAGYHHGIALKSDGSVWTWGYNYYGQLGDGTTANRSLPVQVKGTNGEGYLSHNWLNKKIVFKNEIYRISVSQMEPFSRLDSFWWRMGRRVFI